MGNCQATADADAVVIYHPSNGCNRSYKIHRSTSVAAEEIMVSYPGYYVALVGTVLTEEGIRLKQIRLLRPRDTLSIGCVYRLVSFEDVLLELSAKTRGKLVVRSGGGDEVDEEEGGQSRTKGSSSRTRSRKPRTSNSGSDEVAEETEQIESSDATTTSTTTTATTTSSSSSGRMHCRPWRPSLESISEFGVGQAQ